MPLKKNDPLLDLELKVPTDEDRPPPLEYHALSPEQYLDFIMLGIKMNPNIKKALEHHMKHAPKVRFTL